MFEFVVVSPGGSWDPSLPIAGARAGAVGLLDLCYLMDVGRARRAAARLARGARARFGLVIDSRLGDVEYAALEALGSCDTVLLTADNGTDLGEAAARCRRSARRVGLVCTCAADARAAAASGLDFVVAKGHEAGGRVGQETCYVLLQRLLTWEQLPVFAWGGVGLHTAAACRVAGAAGVFLDWQLAQTREAAIPARFRRQIATMDGSETTVVRYGEGELFRFYTSRGAAAGDKIVALARELREGTAPKPDLWNRTLGLLLDDDRVDTRLWPIGQDVALASGWPAEASTVGRVLATLRANVDEQVSGCARGGVLTRENPLAQSHGTDYPVVQGPMTRVSDTPEFCAAVAQAGGLPFLALGLRRGPEARALLDQARKLLGARSWGVGILGFIDRELLAEQVAAIEQVRPPYAIIAGGRPDQAAPLEATGVRTYLHVSSPEILRMFLRARARRFVFEGSECGGHVGPRTSFVLWDSMIRVLLEANLDDEEAAAVHVLFAGGIHDALSAAMVSGMAQPLVARGIRVGVLLGSAYLFTKEIVQTGAVTSAFQQIARDAEWTVVLESGPGHAIRCADTEYARQFESKKLALERQGCSAADARDALELMNLGRLRIASKEVVPAAGMAGNDRQFTSISEAEQRRSGMYMMGQVAALRGECRTIRALHEDVCEGAVARLAALETEPTSCVRERDKAKPDPLDVAIVGMSCLLPGAKNLDTFWHNIMSKHDAVREIPADRFECARWFSATRRPGNTCYSKWGGFIDEVPFDPLKYGIPPSALPSTEPMQLLALEVVDTALRDAGYAKDNPSRARTSVILGVGGGTSELGTNYTFRALVPQFIENPDASLWRQLPEWTEDSFPGILPNIVAGRVANRFDLGGVNYIVDAACASSMAAIYQACRELADGTSDMVISGGCDTVQNPLGYVCFSNTGALSPRGRSQPFDAGADGIVISEGLAVVVLKRRADAERDGDRIYALIRAVMGGSDGRSKGLTAPHAAGQARVLEGAYAQAGFSPSTIGLIEAHGTGTEVGDQAECEAWSRVLAGCRVASRGIALGSVKSMIGHTKCAAGATGLIKAALAVYHRVLPPTLNVETPNPKAGLDDGPLYVNSELRPWIRGEHPRRAGVSAFGFGGSNFHAVVEEYEDDARPRGWQTPHRRRVAELFVLAGSSRDRLMRKLRELSDAVGKVTAAGDEIELADLAYTVHCRGSGRFEAHRAAIVASTTTQLRERLAALDAWLTEDDRTRPRLPSGVYCGEPGVPSGGVEVAFLFPGQGAQFPNMLCDLAVEFSEVRTCFERADQVLGEALERPLSRFVFPPPMFTDRDRAVAFEELEATDVAQPALGACDLGMARVLASFGMTTAMVGGHSYGELVALCAAGCMDERTLYRLSWERGEAMVAASREQTDADLGQMLAVAADVAAVRRVVDGCPSVWLANLNSPSQTILSGSRAGLEQARQRLQASGMASTRVPVACAFHSPMMAPAQRRFAEVLERADFQAPELPVYSNVTAAPYPAAAQGIRRLLAEQLVNHVRFIEQVEAMYAAGARVFVEVGPKRILSKLVGQILGERPHAAVPTQPTGEHGVRELLLALADLVVHGVDVDLERLYEGRAVSALDLSTPPKEERAERDRNVWLVNGAYVRPASEPRRTPVERAVMRPMGTEPASAAAPSAQQNGGGRVDAEGEQTTTPSSSSPLSTADVEAFAQFQETMRQFLRTQQAVMEAFCGTGTASTFPTPAEVEAAGRAEATHPTPAAAVGTEQGTPSSMPQERDAQSSVGTASGEGASLEERLQAVVSERTGYPPEMLDADANLEADLGIDSIKRVEIIGTFRRSVLPALKEPPAWFMERMGEVTTIRAICAGVAELIERHDGQASARSEPASSVSGEDVPPAAEAIGSRPSAPGTLSPAAPSDRLRSELDRGSPAPTASTSAGRPPLSPSETCPRCVAKPAACSLPEGSEVEMPDGVILITDDGRGVAAALARSVSSRGGRAVVMTASQLCSRSAAEASVASIRRVHGSIGALVHLVPLREAPTFPGIAPDVWSAHIESELVSLLSLLQAIAPELSTSRDEAVTVLSVSQGGGDFGGPADREAVHPWRGGLAGLLKTAAREWDQARFRAIDFDETPETAVLLRELCADGPAEVGYRDGRRWTLAVVPEELPHPAPSGEPLDDQDVVLVTGGARGITAQVAHEIALRSRATLILLGRSPMPQEDEDESTAAIRDRGELRQALIARMRSTDESVSPAAVEAQLAEVLRGREVRRTLTAIQDAGGQVVYRCCDVRDRIALQSAVEDLQRHHGPVSAVLHGAGIIADRYIVEKDAASFARVVGTKVDPVLTLTDILDPAAVKLVMLFASVAGIFGNPGQGDYAAANEILNRMARRLRSVWRAKVVAMNWGPWSGTGMVTPEVARQFEARGVGMVTVPAGRQAAWQEIVSGGGDDVRVIVGPGPWIERATPADLTDPARLAAASR